MKIKAAAMLMTLILAAGSVTACAEKTNGSCLLINMEAQATTLQSDGVEEGYDTAEGNDVPVEVVLTKKEGEFYIESVKEYDSLEIAQNENKNFIKND